MRKQVVRAKKVQKVMLNWIESQRFQDIVKFYSDKNLLDHLAMFKVNLTNNEAIVEHLGCMRNLKNIISSGYNSYEELLNKILGRLDLLSERDEVRLFFDRRILMHRFTQGQYNDEIEFICLINTVFRWIHCDYLLVDDKEDGCTYAYIFVFDMSDYIKAQEGKEDTLKNELDSLTSLPNRVFYSSVAPMILGENMKKGKTTKFIHFDVENFKEYNEKYGAKQGDELLKYLAEALDEVFPESLVAHFAQDHFIVVSSEYNIVDKIDIIYHCVALYSDSEKLEVKAGIYEAKEDIDVIIASDRAKIACDSIKGRYREKYRFFDNELVEIVNKQKYIVDNIDSAIANKHLVVFYQPVFSAKTGKLSGFEALSRWVDPVYGNLSPADYIGILEEYRLIHKLDKFMVSAICENLAKLKDEGVKLVPISVNLSRLDFELGDMVSYIDKVVQKHKIDKNLIKMEITESVLMENPDDLKFQIEKFQTRGYEVWMDDFGCGYSSFNVLKDFDFNMLKIDMLFMKDFDTNPKTKKILKAIVNMAETLGISTLAEGVETKEQFDFLKKIGCNHAQGYLFGKPAPFDEKLIEFVKENIDNKEKTKKSKRLSNNHRTVGRKSIKKNKSSKNTKLLGNHNNINPDELCINV